MLKLGWLGRQPRESSEQELPENVHALAVTPGVRASVHENGILLLHIPTGRVFQSNRTGAKIWQGLSNGLQPDAISTEISRDYCVPQDLVAQHTASFLIALEEHGFVTRTGDAKS
jgi:hypothetical protein